MVSLGNTIRHAYYYESITEPHVMVISESAMDNMKSRPRMKKLLHLQLKNMDKPARELVAFGKTGLLQPGESQTLEFMVTTADIASFDQESSSWAAEAGEYALKVGASSLDIRQTGTFSLQKAMNAGTVSRSLLPEKEINMIYAN